jgi:hypothetical protein
VWLMSSGWLTGSQGYGGWRPTYHGFVRDVPADLPGHDLITAGLADLAAGRRPLQRCWSR